MVKQSTGTKFRDNCYSMSSVGLGRLICGVAIVTLLCVVASAGACDTQVSEETQVRGEAPSAGLGSHAAVTETSTTLAPTITQNGAGISEPLAGDFVWQPDLGLEYGAHISNRNGLGIVDGDRESLCFQAPNGKGALCSLYVLDKATGQVTELANQCDGMINVLQDTVYYIGQVERGVYRYDRCTGSVEKLYAGVILNLLATQERLYVISGAKDLLEIELATSRTTKVLERVSAYNLEYVNGYVYFAQTSTDPLDLDCSIYRTRDDGTHRLEQVIANVPGPIQMVGSTKVLFCDERGYHLLDLDTRAEVTVYQFRDDLRVGLPGANGNGIFYVTSDEDGYRELWVFDVSTGKTSMLMPVRGGSIAFVQDEVYLVNAVNFDIWRVFLDVGDRRAELLLRGDSQAVPEEY